MYRHRQESTETKLDIQNFRNVQEIKNKMRFELTFKINH